MPLWRRSCMVTIMGSTAVSGPAVLPTRLPVWRPPPCGDEAKRVDKGCRWHPDPGVQVLLRIVVLGRQDDEAGERPVDDVGALEGMPEVQWRRRAIDAQAGLVDVAPLVVAIAVGVFGAEEDAAGRGVEFGHVVEDGRDVLRAAPAIGGRRQEHAELVDLEQDRRLAVHGGQQAGAGGDLVAAEMMRRGRLRGRVR